MVEINRETRELPPQRRRSFNTTMALEGVIATVTVGFYDDGRIAEVFISDVKSGVKMDSLSRDAAILLSLGVQHGVPIETMHKAVTRDLQNQPQTFVGVLLDYFMREMEIMQEEMRGGAVQPKEPTSAEQAGEGGSVREGDLCQVVDLDIKGQEQGSVLAVSDVGGQGDDRPAQG